MKKRIFSLLFALCLAAGMLPTVAYAEGGTSREGWTELTKNILDETYKRNSVGAYYYVLPSGNYYLGKDISVDIGIDIGTYATPANVVLDLNGHELKDVSNNTTGSLIYFPSTSSTNTLTLMDSSSGKTGKVIRSSGTTAKLSENAKLNANGGTIEGLVELVDNTAVIDNTDPSNVTVFTGWVSNYSGTIKGGIFYGTVSGGTIEDSAKVTVTFNSNGGNDVAEQKVLRGQKVTEPTAPTKAGYSFDGWYNGDTLYDFNTPVTENITLTAKWSVVWTELTQTSIETYKNGNDYILPSGHYYLGGSISVDTTIRIGDGSNTADVTLDLNGYTLRNDTNNGSLLEIIGSTSSSDTTLTLMDSSLGKTGKVIRSSGTTAKLSENAKLNANGGTIEGLVELVDNTAVIENADPSNVTVFTGWVSNHGGTIKGGTFNGTVTNRGIINGGTFNNEVTNGIKIDFFTYPGKITGGTFYDSVDNTYYGTITGGTFYGAISGNKPGSGATYRRIVTFDSNGGSDVSSQDILKDSTATEPAAPTKAGYSFDGWYQGNTAFDFANTPVTENITLTAKWIPKTYHVTLNTNGADSCAELTEYTYGIGATLPTPVKAGYTFVGWYADSSFSGNAVTNISTTDTEDKTFYAKWDEKSNISFDTTPQSYTYNGSAQAFSITGTAVTGFDISYEQDGNIASNPTNAGSYDVIITRAEDNTYKAVNVTISNGLVIEPATPTENPAKKTTARVAKGRTLADATVTNGEILDVDGTTPLTGTFAWVDSTKVMSADGTEQMIFTPDNTNYVPITIDVAVSTYSTGGGYTPPTYPPTVKQPDEGGTVTVSPKNPEKGDKVTITPKPDEGYEVEQILVTDKNGNAVEVTNNGDGTYSFTQPADKVNVKVTFMDDNTMLSFFVDVFPGDYYYDAVLWAAKNGITGGVDDTHFAPNGICTRAQAVTFLWRAAGSPAPKNSEMPFTDVAAGSYYHDAVLWAVEQGITKGTGDTTFSPDATCTRGQIVTFLWRAAGSPAPKNSEMSFTDVKTGDYYYNAVLWAEQNEITGGIGGGLFGSGNDCTRSQIVTFLYRSNQAK